MTAARRIEFAIQVAGGQIQHAETGLEAIVKEAELAEDLGFDAVFVPDHYVFERLGAMQPDIPAYEMSLVMATLAQRTKRIRIGSQVACMLFRHPGMMARLFAQLDEASNGRMIAGVGAGWTRAEFEMFHLPFPPVSQRLAMMEEAVEIMRALWRESPVSFEGEYYRLTDAVMLPRPVQRPGPPIMLGGSGKGVLRRAGRWADIIHMTPAIGGPGTTTIASVSAFTDDTVPEKLALVRESGIAAGRPADAVRYATTIYNYSPTATSEQTLALAEQLGGLFQLPPQAILRHPVVLAGTPEEMREEIRRRAETHGLSLMAINFSSVEQIRAFSEQVMSKL